MTIAERATRLMASVLQRDVDPDLTLDADGGVTPLEVARFVVASEKAFGVPILDECVVQWRTLQDACAYIEGLLEAGEGGKAIREEEERTDWFYS